MTWTLQFTLVDAKNETSTTEVNIPEQLLFDTVEATGQAFAALIDQLTTGAVTRITALHTIDLPGGLTPLPDGASDVEEGARFQFKTANGFYTALRLPTFDEGRIVTGTKEVDQVDADVAAFIQAMVDGVSVAAGPTVQPCDKRGEDIAQLTFAREQFVSSR